MTEKTTAVEIVRRALGPQLARRARSERAWSALEAAVDRAHRYGHDPVALLDRVAHSRELRTAGSVSEVLAWRIGRYLTTGHGPAPSRAETSTPKVDRRTWATLAWALKAAENNGCDLAEAAASVSTAPDLIGAPFSLAQAAARQRVKPLVPPWISEPAPAPVGDLEAERQMAGYLGAVADAIRKRVDALTADAARAKPAWMQVLGPLPSGHARYKEWLHHVGVVAAYRDQYRVISDDPQQVLGPYAEPGHTGHRAYWHAADSVLNARAIAGLERPETVRNEVGAQLTADLYLSLDRAEKAVVHSAMAEHLGFLWFGANEETDDHVVTRPVYASELAAVLTERGHLTQQIARLRSSADTPGVIATTREGPLEAQYARQQARRQNASLSAAQRPSTAATTQSSRAAAPHHQAIRPPTSIEYPNGPHTLKF